MALAERGGVLVEMGRLAALVLLVGEAEGEPLDLTAAQGVWTHAFPHLMAQVEGVAAEGAVVVRAPQGVMVGGMGVEVEAEGMAPRMVSGVMGLLLLLL